MLIMLMFWVPLALLAWVYVVYPLVALAWGRLRPVRLAATGSWPSLVSVGLAVHDGEAQLADRIANVFDQAVPFPIEVIVASDGSRDRTVAIATELATDNPRIRSLDLQRSGQSAAQSAIFEQARGEVVVLTDIDTRYEPGCLEDLVAPFADERVGCTTGVLRWHYDRRTPTAYHEGMYWRYEQRVRTWESRAGWLAAATGALLACRRELFGPIPAHASLDQMLPLHASERGRYVIALPCAIGRDEGTFSVSDQFRSRTRIATQGIEANLRMATRITPWRRPGAALAIWSHKLLRWTTPFLGGLVAAAGAVLYSLGEPVAYLVPLAIAAAIMVVAAIGYAGRRAGRSVPLTGLAVTIVTINAAFALGWLNVLLRRKIGAWEPGGHSL